MELHLAALRASKKAALKGQRMVESMAYWKAALTELHSAVLMASPKAASMVRRKVDPTASLKAAQRELSLAE